MFNKNYSEVIGSKIAVIPADLNGGATIGEKITMSKGNRVLIKVLMGDSVGASVIFNLKQSQDAAGTGIKALPTFSNYYHKVGAATVFTEVKGDVDAPVSSYDVSALFAADEGILHLEVHAEDLDLENDFAFLSVDIVDPAAAKVIGVSYEVLGGFNKSMHEVAL